MEFETELSDLKNLFAEFVAEFHQINVTSGNHLPMEPQKSINCLNDANAMLESDIVWSNEISSNETYLSGNNTVHPKVTSDTGHSSMEPKNSNNYFTGVDAMQKLDIVWSDEISSCETYLSGNNTVHPKNGEDVSYVAKSLTMIDNEKLFSEQFIEDLCYLDLDTQHLVQHQRDANTNLVIKQQAVKPINATVETNYPLDNVLQTSSGEKNQFVNFLYYLYEKPMSSDQTNVHESVTSDTGHSSMEPKNSNNYFTGVDAMQKLDIVWSDEISSCETYLSGNNTVHPKNGEDVSYVAKSLTMIDNEKLFSEQFIEDLCYLDLDTQHLVQHQRDANTNLVIKQQAVKPINATVETNYPLAKPFQLTVLPKQVRGCDNADMYVETSNSGVKKQCCPFCGKLYSKLPRHMEDMHGSEPDVQEFLIHPKNSAMRKAILDDLRKTGNFNHNRIAEMNKKLYIPSRRPNVNHKREVFQHSFCPYCRGAHSSTALRLHIKYRCPKKPKINDEKLEGGRVERVTRKLATVVDGRIHESASTKLEHLLQTKKREDNVVRLVRFDWLLILYGNKLCKKYTRLKNRAMIRARLRLGGRILIALKSIQPQITDFESLYHPKFYDFVVEAIEIVARHNAEREEFDFPATASKCITGIREIAAILISEYIKRDNVEKHRTTENFMTVFNTEISTDIAKAVTETQIRRKIEKQVIVPSLDDVTILARHIHEKRNEFFGKLSMSFSYKNWIALAEAIVGSIIVFNRKRIGDVEDILVCNFKRRESIKESTSDPLYNNLSEEEKKVARQYSRMQVRGKLGHVVSVMLKPEIEKSIELLLSHRQDARIPEKNEFLFALPSSLNEVAVMNAYVILKKFALSCGAKDPLILTGTLLRKHLATHCASLNLNDSRVADVAGHLGHSVGVHRQFYRQNTVERQFVHLSQVLEVSQGNASIVTFPNQINTKQMTRDTDLEREGPSTSQPKYQSMQNQNVRPQSQQKNNCKNGRNNNIKKTGNKITSKRQLSGSPYSATRSKKNVDLKQCSEGVLRKRESHRMNVSTKN